MIFMALHTFVFDLDETLLCSARSLGWMNKVPRELSQTNPYGENTACYTIQKKEIKKILEEILKNGDKIATITAGDLKEEEVRTFFKQEYGIELSSDYEHYFELREKVPTLKLIAGTWTPEVAGSIIPGAGRPYSCVTMIDNSSEVIQQAKEAGFKTVYVDNNWFDPTDGQIWIERLKYLVKQRTRELEVANPKTPNLMFDSYSKKPDGDSGPSASFN
ncbi:hypothetical protein PsalN5692_03600 (plasmid) [Piscirickettsia salmonis]|nr:hypothetical protein PsalN5692_03600 [Piscirickettsia salmonis]